MYRIHAPLEHLESVEGDANFGVVIHIVWVLELKDFSPDGTVVRCKENYLETAIVMRDIVPTPAFALQVPRARIDDEIAPARTIELFTLIWVILFLVFSVDPRM